MLAGKKDKTDPIKKRVRSQKSSVATKTKTKTRVTKTKSKTKSKAPARVHASAERLNYVFSDTEELPTNYNRSSLTLIARDPFWIHALWEIAPASVDELRETIGAQLAHATYAIRLYDVTLKDFNGKNENHFFDIDISLDVNNWYINLWKDHVTYCGALGIKTPDGHFYILARSNFVTTPRKSSSDRMDMIWMNVKENQEENKNSFEGDSFVYIDFNDFASGKVIAGRKRMHRIDLTGDDIRAYYQQLLPLLKVIKSRCANNGGGGETFDLVDAQLEKSWSESTAKMFSRTVKIGASEKLVLKGGASEEHIGASEQSAGQPPFFFELGTELIVYGRTQPGATVHWCGKKIVLRPDGSFSFRLALADENIPLDFVAVAGDQRQRRSITTAVERSKTKYSCA